MHTLRRIIACHPKILLHRDFVIPMLSLEASKVRDYKIPNQPPNKKWKFLYDQVKVKAGPGSLGIRGRKRLLVKNILLLSREVKRFFSG